MDPIQPILGDFGTLDVTYPVTASTFAVSGSLALISWFFSNFKYDDDYNARCELWPERNSYVCWSNGRSRYNKIEI